MNRAVLFFVSLVIFLPDGALASIRFSGTIDQSYDRIAIPVDNGASANIGATDFTIEIWLNAGAANSSSGGAFFNGHIFLDMDRLSGTDSLVLSLHAGVPQIYVRVDGQSGFRNAGADVRGSWTWLVFTRNASTGEVQIYVNGNREVLATLPSGDLSYSGGGNTKDRLIELGGEKHFQGTPSYIGYMSEIRFSSTVRYSGASIAVPSSPLLVDANTLTYWGFTEGSGSVLADSATGGSHGTVVFGGSPQVPVWSAESPYSGISPGNIQFSSDTIDVSESETLVTASVVRAGGSSGAASVSVSTAPGTATPGADYQTTQTVLNWQDSEMGSQPVSVTLFPDSQPEADETFTVNLSNVIGATPGAEQVATVTILDNDVGGGLSGTIQFAQSTYSAQEADGSTSIGVTRTGGNTGQIAAGYTSADGTATAGADYSSVDSTIEFADGEDGTKSFQINLLNDTLVEASETIELALSGANVGTPANATLTIVDDDNAPGPPESSGGGALGLYSILALFGLAVRRSPRFGPRR